MPYTTAAAIQGMIGEARLIELSSVDGGATVDADVVAAAVDEADRLIDSYAGKRYAVPLATVPSTIASLSARMAIRIMRRNRMMTLAQDVTDEENDRKWLEALAMGKVSPGVDAHPTASADSIDKYSDRSNDSPPRLVSRNRTKGFW